VHARREWQRAVAAVKGAPSGLSEGKMGRVQPCKGPVCDLHAGQAVGVFHGDVLPMLGCQAAPPAPPHPTPCGRRFSIARVQGAWLRLWRMVRADAGWAPAAGWRLSRHAQAAEAPHMLVMGVKAASVGCAGRASCASCTSGVIATSPWGAEGVCVGGAGVRGFARCARMAATSATGGADARAGAYLLGRSDLRHNAAPPRPQVKCQG
jgi:hypothetical protein